MSWKSVCIGDLCIKITDGSHFSPQAVENGFPMFSVKDMMENGFNYSEVKKISLNDYKKLVRSDCKPKKDDILIAKDGSYLKYAFVCKEEKEEVILSSIAILRPDIKTIYPDFFKHLLCTPSVKGMMESFVSGSALPRIVLKDFKKMKLTIPDLNLQRKIALVISSYDDLIEVNNQRIKLLEKTAREIYNEWFVRMRFQGYKKTKFVKGVPEGWEVKNIGDLIKIKNGKAIVLTDNGMFKVFGSNGQIATSNDYNYENVLIIGRVGAYCGSISIGRGKIWATDNTLVAIPDNNRAGFFFSYYLLKDLDLGNFASGSAQPLLTQSIINKLKFLLPTSKIVDNYEANSAPLFEQIDNLESQNIVLRQIRDRLLPRLISGKLRIKD